jgi:hypothetical protein
MNRIIFTLLFFFTYLPTSWGVVEFGLNAGYDKQIFGSERMSSITSLTYSGSLAFYFWKNVAFELNYSQTEDKTTQVYDKDLTQDVSILRLENRIFTKVYGAGFRVSLGSKRSRIVPMLSMGYAKQFIEDNTTYQIFDSTDSSEATLEFTVINSDKPAIENLFNFPNPLNSKTTFSFSHNLSGKPINIEINIFSIIGKRVKTINVPLTPTGNVSQQIHWNGKSDSGGRVPPGVYPYNLTIITDSGEKAAMSSKLIIY